MLKSRLKAIALAMPQVIDEAFKDGAEAVADAARTRVPVRSGALQEAIHVQEEEEGVYVVAGNTEVFYGHIVEHGSENTAPRPFLIPAFEEHKPRILARGRAALSRLG